MISDKEFKLIIKNRFLQNHSDYKLKNMDDFDKDYDSILEIIKTSMSSKWISNAERKIVILTLSSETHHDKTIILREITLVMNHYDYSLTDKNKNQFDVDVSYNHLMKMFTYQIVIYNNELSDLDDMMAFSNKTIMNKVFNRKMKHIDDNYKNAMSSTKKFLKEHKDNLEVMDLMFADVFKNNSTKFPITEYKHKDGFRDEFFKFMTLLAKENKKYGMLNPYIDLFWHNMICQTRFYRNFCKFLTKRNDIIYHFVGTTSTYDNDSDNYDLLLLDIENNDLSTHYELVTYWKIRHNFNFKTRNSKNVGESSNSSETNSSFSSNGVEDFVLLNTLVQPSYASDTPVNNSNGNSHEDLSSKLGSTINQNNSSNHSSNHSSDSHHSSSTPSSSHSSSHHSSCSSGHSSCSSGHSSCSGGSSCGSSCGGGSSCGS